MWRNTLPPFWEGPAIFPPPIPLVPACPPACCILGQGAAAAQPGRGPPVIIGQAAPAGIAFGTQPEHSKPPNHCNYNESC